MNYVVYYRVSTKRQGESGLGLEAQKAVVEYYAEREGLSIECSFVESISGKEIDNRPELQKAITYVQNNPSTQLVVAKLDRLSRSVEDIFKIKRLIGDRLKSCDLPNTETLTIGMFALFAQHEREIISIRTKAALKAKRKRGEALGTPANLTRGKLGSLGRIKAAKEHKNNKRAQGYIKALRETGKTFRTIASILNKEGFSTVRGKEFQATTVKRLFDRA